MSERKGFARNLGHRLFRSQVSKARPGTPGWGWWDYLNGKHFGLPGGWSAASGELPKQGKSPSALILRRKGINPCKGIEKCVPGFKGETSALGSVIH